MPPKKASSSDECVRVVVRVRPRNDGEMRNNNKVIVNMISDTAQVCVERPDGEKQYFTFDSVYDHDSRQDTLFDETARPIIDSVIEGYNGTIFAYGQTGTGKTHTMHPKQPANTLSDERVLGINLTARIARAAVQLADVVKQQSGTP